MSRFSSAIMRLETDARAARARGELARASHIWMRISGLHTRNATWWSRVSFVAAMVSCACGLITIALKLVAVAMR